MRNLDLQKAKSDIYELKSQIQSLERERDNARQDNTRLAAWLKLRYPEAFKAYFLKSE